jgi:hypothetical protein
VVQASGSGGGSWVVEPMEERVREVGRLRECGECGVFW